MHDHHRTVTPRRGAMRTARVLGTLFALGLVTASAVPSGAGVAHTSVVSANPSDVTPHVLNGEVLAYEQIGNRIYVAGTFTQIKNWNNATVYNQAYLFAYDATTGAIDLTFNPVLNNRVNTLATDGTWLFIGGRFTTVNGQTKNRLTKIAPTTGAPNAWHGNANGIVEDMVLVNGRLYVGGTFTTLKGLVRERLGAITISNGQVDPDLTVAVARPGWTGVADTKVLRLDVTPNNGRLVIGGAFNTVGGQYRAQIAMIDLTTSPDSVSAWSQNSWGEPSPGFTCIHDVPFSPDGTYFVVSSMCGGVPYGDAVARFETTTEVANAIPSWVNWTGWDTEWGAAVTGEAVYVGGHQRSQNACQYCGETGGGAVPRSGIAALDPLNGVPLSWNPGRDRGVGAKALTATPTGLLVGSDTNMIGGEWHPKHAFFPLAGGVDVPVQPRPALPGYLHRFDVTDGFVWQKLTANEVGQEILDSSPIASADLRGGFLADGKFFYPSNVDGRLKSRTWNGVAWGGEVDVQNIPGYYNPSWINFWSVVGLTYDTGWMYAAAVDDNLYRLGFSLESQIIGTQLFVASGPAIDGYSWSQTRSIVVAGDWMFFTTTDGNLHRMEFTGTTPLVNTDTVIAGPGVDGVDYSATAMFVTN